MYKITSLFAILWLQGCAGVLFGSTLISSYFITTFSTIEEIKQEYLTAKDVKKHLRKIKNSNKLKFKTDVVVLQKKIFIVGVASDQRARKYILDKIYLKYPNYKIIDEVKVDIKRNSAKDKFTNIRIKTKLMLTNGVRYGNYYISTYLDEVIIIGYASDKYEASTVLEKITNTRGVKSVLNYIEIKDLGE